MERQKKFLKFAEKLNKVRELSNQLNKCHTLLNQTLENIETLNNALPIEERLEPFVWTTGWQTFDEEQSSDIDDNSDVIDLK